MCFRLPWHRNRCTVFSGAGLSIPVGGLVSTTLTALIRNTTQEYVDPSNPTGPLLRRQFIDEVARVLDVYFAPQSCNFEDIFHALEVLDSCVNVGSTGTIKQFKPHFYPFFTPTIPSAGPWINQFALNAAKKDLLETVANAIHSYDSAFSPAGANTWFAAFWRNMIADLLLDLGTLNYDNTIEHSLQPLHHLEDGYSLSAQPSSFARFEPTHFCGYHGSRMMHLHGNIHFGFDPMRTLNTSTQMFDDEWGDVFKFSTFNEAVQTWPSWWSGTRAQSGEQIVGGPIITGLRKTDKLLTYPYSVYNSEYSEALLRNPRLLVVGYSFGDYHYNSLLGKMPAIHKDRRRIVIITYFPNFDSEWNPDPAVWGNWASRELVNFYVRAFRQPTLPIVFDPGQADPLISSDGRVRAYFRGARHAFENHGQEIINFLNS
jgi:hypothetical protein